MPSFYLIDAHAYLHRAYHALPPMTNSRGEPVNAIYGFLRMILKIMKQYKPDYIAICFDTEAPTFRHERFAQYKGTRKEIDEALISQFPASRQAAQAMNLAIFEKDGYEADDLIAHLTRLGTQKKWDVVIVSGDKDALQLVQPGVRVLNESKDILFDEAKVRERYGVEPALIPDIFALMGDKIDNVPGVPGIGENTAIKLIAEHGGLENLLKAAPSLSGRFGTLLQAHAEAARESRALVTLEGDVPMEVNLEDCAVKPPEFRAITTFLQRMEFFSLLKEIVPTQATLVDTSQRDYQTILTETQLAQWVKQALESDRLAIDVETTSLDALRAGLVGISMSVRPGAACYIPICHTAMGEPKQLPLETVQNHLRPLLAGDKPLIYGHNLKFDATVLKRHGMPIKTLRCDTMLASYVLNPSRNGHGLKDLVLELIHEPMTTIDQLIGKGAKQISMDQVPISQASPYACADADMSLRLADKLEPVVREKGLAKLFYELEMPLIQVLCDMEEAGIAVDQTYLRDLGQQFLVKMAELEKSIYEFAGRTFNINSPKQLASVLFEELKLPVIRRTKTGISTDEEVLQKLSQHHPLPKALMAYREIQKLHSTYVESLINSVHAEEGRVHTSFNQTVAATGRLSSSDPNLQNIPIRTEIGRQIRRAFIADKGTTLLSADYSQIDLRMLAHISQDATLCEAFRKGEDIHTLTAAEIFNMKPVEVGPDMRRVAKSINFGIVYGMSPFGLSQQLQITVEEAKVHIDRYFVRYPGVRAWIDAILKEAREKGSVRTLLGRIRYLPEIESKNGAIRGFAERTAMNTPIQGTSADVIKAAMIQLAQTHAQKKWKGRMLLQVHDELLFEIEHAEMERSQKVIKSIMENAIPLSIPVVVDLKVGTSWADMKPVPAASAHPS